MKHYNGNNFTEYTREIAHLNSSKKNVFRFNSQI